MLLNKEGKAVDLPRSAKERELSQVTEVLVPGPTYEAPKGFFSIETRAKLR